MLPDRVSNPRSLTYESGTLPIALCGPAGQMEMGPWFKVSFERLKKQGIDLPVTGSVSFEINRYPPKAKITT